MTSIPGNVREQVRRRASARCEYCHKPEIASAYPHHVEHIIARKHGGSSDPENLAWACFQCNVAKGSDIASYDSETRELTPLYNPRTQHWQEHFEIIGDKVEGKTAVGRVTARLLQMNQPEQTEVRRLLILSGEW